MDDRRFDFDESLLVPSTREDIADLCARLERLMTEMAGGRCPRALPPAALRRRPPRLRRRFSGLPEIQGSPGESISGAPEIEDGSGKWNSGSRKIQGGSGK